MRARAHMVFRLDRSVSCMHGQLEVLKIKFRSRTENEWFFELDFEWIFLLKTMIQKLNLRLSSLDLGKK